MQFVAVDVAYVEGVRSGAGADRDAHVGVGEQFQGGGGGVGGVGGAEGAEGQVGAGEGPFDAVGGGVVAPVEVRGAAGEAGAAEFVVFEAVEVGVDAAGGGAAS